jgi:hypothetical protein
LRRLVETVVEGSGTEPDSFDAGPNNRDLTIVQ